MKEYCALILRYAENYDIRRSDVMNMKSTLKKAAAAFLTLALTVGATGCTFLVTDNEKDLKQSIATVNISGTMEKDEAYKEYADDIQSLVDKGGLVTDIPKRDLIAYFLSTGYNYVQNYGYTYEDTFNMLIDGLVEQKILTQYAVAYYLKNGKDMSVDKCMEYVNAELAKASTKQKALLEANPQVLTMKYFLTEGGTNSEDFDKAVYSLKKSLNSSLDSAEANYITAKDDEHTHDETRTTPTNVNTQKEDFIPKKADGALDYEIYTGRNALDACGTYEKVDGSTVTSRKKAYNAFLSNLQGYGLIKEGEDTANVTELDYYYLELSSSLANALVTKYGEDLQETATEFLSEEYVSAKYKELYDAQELAYKNDPTAFDTALDSVSDTSFALYGKKDFGFVYNILIPFSSAQSAEYAVAKNKGLSQEQLFGVRRQILEDVEAKDLRSAWFCADNEDEHYAYLNTECYTANNAERKYLFFENNFTKTEEYEGLKQYAGKYSYNGTVKTPDENDGEWGLTPNKMKIGTASENGFIQEMESYIEYVVGGDVVGTGTYHTAYNGNYVSESNKVDYSKFVYYTNKVTLTNTSRADFFNKEKKAGEETVKNDSYLALSAVNELMFAYSTDTGCLNSYMGYVVSPYKTDFVPEFEYAAQYAVQQGVGTIVVAPSDYGWHIIYCSFKFEEGDVYGGYKHSEKDIEGTFSNLFYESLKSSASGSYTTAAQNDVLNRYNDDNAVTKHEKAYKDLLKLDA